jgi:hypothetical protein
MTFAAQMRLGSLEILAALVVFGVLAGRMKPGLPQAAERVVARIELEVNERGAVRQMEAALPLVVGRSSEADLPLGDPEVSRRHARFEAERGVVYLTDLQSSNGTFLNGERVYESIELRPGDHIDVGSTRMVYVRQATPWK